MSELYGVKVEDIFNTMKERFRPEGPKDTEGAFGYDIAGKGKWKLTVKGGAMEIEKTDDLSGCIVTTIADPDTFVGVNIGKVDGGTAFSSGKFKVDGDLGALAKTARMFRKFVPKKKEMTVREYLDDMFGTVEARFIPAASKGLDIIIAIDIQDQDNPGQWSVFVKDGACKVKTGIEIKPTVTLEVYKAKDWVDLTLGKTDAQTLMAAGAGSVKGDLPTAMKWGELFDKYVDPCGGDEKTEELIVLKKTISVNQRYATGPVMGKFFQGLKNKKIFGNRCPVCGRIQLPPREVCAVCRVKVDEFVEVGPKGELRLMETVYYSSPDPLTGETRETPYAAINVLFDGCRGNEVMWHFLRKDQLDRVTMGRNSKKGTRLRPVWREDRRGDVFDIQYFEIDE